MKVWAVPVTYEASGLIDVKANTLGEAIRKAEYCKPTEMYNKDESRLLVSMNYDTEDIREFFNGGELDDE